METVKVVMCPYCGDSWITDNEDITKIECHCFRCDGKYFPTKVLSMWRFVYEALISVKGK